MKPDVERQTHRRDVVFKALGHLVHAAESRPACGGGYQNMAEHFVCEQGESCDRRCRNLPGPFRASRDRMAGEPDACVERNQQGHGIANRRAVGDVAAQRAGLAYRQAGESGERKALSCGRVLTPVPSNASCSRTAAPISSQSLPGQLESFEGFDAGQFVVCADVEHGIGKATVHLGHPQDRHRLHRRQFGLRGFDLRTSRRAFSVAGRYTVLTEPALRIGLVSRAICCKCGEMICALGLLHNAGNFIIALRCIDNGPVSGATAQVAGQR